MPLVITPRDPAAGSPLTVDLAGVVPDRIAALGLAEIERLPIAADGRSARLGDCFVVAGDPRDLAVHCRGNFSRVHRIGAGMAAGSLAVIGDAGRHAGAGMTGGRLSVSGRAGDWLACHLAGGEVHVSGDAGDNVAASHPGERVGMTGGLVVVAGCVGHLVGSRLRRGVVVVGKDCGAAAGFEMRAGTIVVGGRLGPQPGLAMQRGSVIALTTRPRVPATFRRGAAWNPPFLPLLLRRLASAGFAPPARAGDRPWRQWHGDTLAGGRGELLHPA